MQTTYNGTLTRTLFALGLTAIALPTLAVTNINSCREITSPGSYRVTQDLNFQGINLEACLAIKVSDVTVDLQGHTLRGNGVGTGIEVNTLPLLSNIEVHNGTVRFFRSGIFFNVAGGARVEQMRVLDNGFQGITVSTQDSSIVTSNLSTNNPGGIFVSGNGLVVDNNASENSRDGIELRGNGIVRGNVANANGSNGIVVDCPALVVDNIAVKNARGDLRTRSGGTGCRITNNVTPTIGN